MKYLICIAIALISHSCALLRLYPDNPIEEKAEDLIEEETGVKIDFTGDTPE